MSYSDGREIAEKIHPKTAASEEKVISIDRITIKIRNWERQPPKGKPPPTAP